jgi:predicted O-linked N-acetylglucosamine transferase (SPINDLY family)
MNTQDAAASIAARGIEILIDLNGHTQNSGLPVMAHRPAPIQLSFLGLPTTTGAPFVDYYLADYIAV